MDGSNSEIHLMFLRLSYQLEAQSAAEPRVTAGYLLVDTGLTPMGVCVFGTWTCGLNFPASTAITRDCLLEMDIQSAPYGILQGDIPVNTITSLG